MLIKSSTLSLNQMVPHVVVVDVCQARNVKKMDLLSQSDTYLKVAFTLILHPSSFMLGIQSIKQHKYNQ
jgi:hypothetical protein